MDESVSNFFAKNAADNYAQQYEIDHGPRLDAMLTHWGLVEYLKGKRVVDIGGGLGFLGKRLDKSTEYWVVDGAQISDEHRLCSGRWFFNDLDRDEFSRPVLRAIQRGHVGNSEGQIKFDVAFCLETLEHLTSPYNCLAETKKILKDNGDLIISIPHENVTHNAIYPALLWPPSNWEQFLGQLALPIKDRWLWDKGWNARHWWVKNRPYREKVMAFAKQESKFIDATPVEMVNW